MIGFALGVISALTFVSIMGRRRPTRHKVAYEAPICQVKIRLWETMRHDIGSLLSDFGGGGLGVSHTSIDLCEKDDHGNALQVECLPKKGVIRTPLSKYEKRRCAVIIIGGHEGSEMRGCVRGKVGQPFHKLGILGGIDNPHALMCSTLAYQCLPARLRKIVVPAKPSGAYGVAVSPGQLLKAFGAKVGGPPVYIGPTW